LIIYTDARAVDESEGETASCADEKDGGSVEEEGDVGVGEEDRGPCGEELVDGREALRRWEEE
jgi:hypothetical protein